MTTRIKIEMAHLSLHKYGEELCGDRVETAVSEDTRFLILTDGMGSGVRANIPATLTARILSTMLAEGSSLEECVNTVAQTLPPNPEQGVAYCTFTVLEIRSSGDVRIINYENPDCIVLRNGLLFEPEYTECRIGDKKILEAHFPASRNDIFVLMSDGAVFAGSGELLNYGWTRESIASYLLSKTPSHLSAARIASLLSSACKELYLGRPADDTTIAAAKILEPKTVNLFTGPPASPMQDADCMRAFFRAPGLHVVCGGVSSKIAAAHLRRKIRTGSPGDDPDLPPIAYIQGIDLVTEGVLTMGKTLSYLQRYIQEQVDEAFFLELDRDNGAAALARILIEQCTDLNLIVGRAVNNAHHDKALPFDLNVRSHLVRDMVSLMERMGKNVTVTYY